MSARENATGVLGHFAYLDELMTALKIARYKGFEIRDVFTPVPVPEAIEYVSRGRSPVRFVTLAGALAGCAGGLGLAVATSLVWNMVVGGKPVTAVVPFVVVMFELTILLGALATLAALLFFARLPFRRFPGRAFRPAFSGDRFGVWLACDRSRSTDARSLLRELGAEKIEEIDDNGATGAEVAP